MKTYILFFLLVFALSYNSLAQKSEVGKNDSVSSDTIDKMISLDEYKGSVLVLYFFSDNMDNWNQPIVELNTLKKKYKNKKVRFSALTSKTQSEVNTFTKSIDFLVFAKSIDFTVITKNDSAAKNDIKLPCVYVIAQNGNIYWKSKSLKHINKKINNLLAGTANVKFDGTNVYEEKIAGKAKRYKDTTPKLDYDDSQGIPHHGLTTSGKTMPGKRKKKSGSRIKGQVIKQYKVTPGIINEREPPRRKN